MASDKSLLDIIIDISKSSETQQIVLGSASGLITGLVSMRIGKIVAVTIGGCIILLQIANENDLIKIRWNQVNDKINKVADKVEEKIIGQPSLIDKVERYVDRKLDKVEDVLKKQKGQVKKWYESSDGKSSIHILFYISFIGGLCIGIAAAS